MSLAQQLAYMPVTELAMRIRRRQLSPVEVVEAYIERIEERNRELNAFVFFGYEDARRRATEAERALVKGEALGLLHGVPTAMKDLYDHKPGWISTYGGVRALRNNVVNMWCPFAERIEKAGAILLGKTNSPIMGFRGTCDNYLFGPSHNPFNLAKNTGGSSGGSAGAVAGGLVPFAEATDGGGSIRVPASFCGLYGLKPSFGRVPLTLRPNAFGGNTPFMSEGALTRTVEDSALVLTALSGYDRRDPHSIRQQDDYVAATRRSIRGWRIAYSPNFDVFPVEARVRAVVDKAVLAFEEAGASVDEIKVGIRRPQHELSDVWCRMVMPGNVAWCEDFKRQGIDFLKEYRADLPPLYLKWVEENWDMTTRQLNADLEVRTEIFDAIQGVFENYDILITPTLSCPAADNADNGDTMGPTEINGEAVDPLLGWCLTYLLNFTGHPAASTPAGLTADNLPVGMQIIGRRDADADVLAASAAFERLRPWYDTYRLCGMTTPSK